MHGFGRQENERAPRGLATGGFLNHAVNPNNTDFSQRSSDLGCCKKEERKRGSGGQSPPAGQGRALPPPSAYSTFISTGSASEETAGS